MPSDASTTGVVCDLRRKVQELEQKLAEAHQREGATSEVLGVIGTSPNDVQPVFQAIAERARQLCKAEVGATTRLEGDVVHLAGVRGPSAEAEQAMRAFFPVERQLAPANIRHALVQRAPFQLADVRLEPGYPDVEAAERMGVRSIVSVPLLHEGRAIGTIGVARGEPGRFADETIVLLQTFARQAVIAIENARLFEAEQARTRELKESLEYQTAISEVLGVISRSPTNLQPVFDAILSSAVRLCHGTIGTAMRFDGELLHLEAHYNHTPESLMVLREVLPGRPDRRLMSGRAILERTAVQVEDAMADPDYSQPLAQAAGFHSMLAVPLLRDGEPVGTIVVNRDYPAPFTPRQVALLETFADQAVIAIENTRLFEEVQARTRELTESLQQQTATADVLKVISRSTFALQPILNTLVENATRLCNAESGLIWRFDGEVFRAAAAYGVKNELVDFWAQNPIRPGRGSVTGRAALERRTVQITDALGDPEYQLADSQKIGGYRTLLGVPMLREDILIGVFGLQRYQVQPFTEKQIELVTTFADQAVIAIENVRLFEEVQAKTHELSRSVAELKALGAVAQTVSSTLDLKVVLARILEHACLMSDAGGGAIYGFDRAMDHFVLAAGHNMIEEHIAAVREHPIRLGESLIGQCAKLRQAMQIDDLTKTPTHPLYEMHLKAGVRAMLAVPLINQDDLIGALIVRRKRVGVFTAETVALLQAFANQSAIALENAHLFEEIARKSRELEIASQHKSQFVANMSHELRTPLAAILGYAELMQEGFYGDQSEKSLDALTRIRSNGKHLLGLINTVLDIAKIESGQFTLNMAEYDIESMVETVRSATESLAQNKKLSLKTEVAKSLPIGLGDEQRLTQVLLNLVGNAIKFTDSGEVRVTATAVDRQFNVSVIDTGPGIPANQQTRIFEQFHQVDSSNIKAKGGTGLGLAIAKQIVEMHGGRIWVESTLGKGSTFQMELPTRTEFRKSAP